MGPIEVSCGESGVQIDSSNSRRTGRSASAVWYVQDSFGGTKYHDVPVADKTPDRVREWTLKLLETQLTA